MRHASLVIALCVLPLSAQDPQCFYVPDNLPAVGTCNSFPFGNASMIYQTIVPAAELAAGAITSLSFAPCSSGVRTLTNVEIRMAHNPAAVLGTTFAANLVAPAGGTVVLSRATLNWNLIADTWNDIPLDAAFRYNGSDNLVVQVKVDNSAGVSGAFHRDVRPRLFATSSSAVTGTLDAAALKMRLCMGVFRYSPTNTPGTGTCNAFPFAQTQMRYQQLVTADDMGNRAGLIRNIAFSSCTAGSRAFTNITVRMAHTTLTALGTTFATNLQTPAGGQVVLNAATTYTYVANDWSDLGLTSAFNYNGQDNLVIEVAVDGGAGASFHRDSLRSRLQVANLTSATGAVDSAALKVRLTVDCPVANRVITATADGCGPVGTGLGIGTSTPFTPILGTSHDLLMRFGPNAGPGGFIFGTTNGAPFPLPLPGAPGCFLRNDIVIILATSFNAGGLSTPVPFPIPFNPYLCGYTYYMQGVAIWPGINPSGLATSNQLIMTIGV